MLTHKSHKNTQNNHKRKQRSGTELDSTASMVQQNDESFQSEIINMQSIIGNQAVMQMSRQQNNKVTHAPIPLNSFVMAPQTSHNSPLQRMPLRAEVLHSLGKPKKNAKIFGKTVKENSTKYVDVLDSLRDFETYTRTNFLEKSKSQLREQMLEVNKLLQEIYDSMSAYEGEKGKKSAYMLQRRDEVKDYQNTSARAFLEKMDNPVGQHILLAPSLVSLLNSAAQNSGTAPLELNQDDKVGSNRGGSKEVSKYDTGNGETGYFIEQQNTLQSFDNNTDEEAWAEQIRQLNEQIEQEGIENGWDEEKITEEKGLRKNALTNQFRLGVQTLGINPEDARMEKRHIAMSRLDQLFGTHLIARAQAAVVHMPDGSKIEGTIMADAGAGGGFSPDEVMQVGSEEPMFASKQEVLDYRSDRLGINDPELMRHLSRLYLIDLIASQIDRNVGNYFIQRDTDGNLLAITGIDNDLAFGTGESSDITEQELQGITRYVDKEMAQMIMELDATILEPILSDLLPENEVQAAIKRMQHLQDELAREETNLLEPDEWLAHKDVIMEEGKSYYSSLAGYNLRNTRGFKYNEST